MYINTLIHVHMLYKPTNPHTHIHTHTRMYVHTYTKAAATDMQGYIYTESTGRVFLSSFGQWGKRRFSLIWDTVSNHNSIISTPETSRFLGI